MKYLIPLVLALAGCLQAPADIVKVPEGTMAIQVKEDAPVPVEAVGLLLKDDESACSMVAVEPEVAMTAAHCVLGETDKKPFSGVMVGLAFDKHGKTSLVSDMEFIWADAETDIALIHVKNGRFYDTVQISMDIPKEHDQVWIVGYGCDSDWPHMNAYRSFRPGWYQGYDSDLKDDIFYAHACHGDSGGALLDMHGQLVGITSAGNEHYTAAARPSDALPGLLQE